jgi:predicted nucleotidyltransferase
MSTQSHDGLSTVLFGRTRSGVLALLYGQAEKSFYLREIARHIGASAGAVQSEMEQLCRAGLVTRTSSGHQVYYQANKASPVFGEMRALVTKTVGVFDVVRSALDAISAKIRVAFIYGSVARHEQTAESDVDIMVIGRARFDEVLARLSKAQGRLGREINPTVYSPREFKAKLADGNNFVTSVMKGDKIFVIGGEDELAEVGGVRMAKAAGN